MLSTTRPPRTRLILSSSGVVYANSLAADSQRLKSHVVAYVSEKIGHLPSDILSREQYESDDGSASIETLVMPEGALWAVRFSEPDEETPGRTWSVEATVGTTKDNLLFSCRLSSFSRTYDFLFDAGVPRILRQVVEDFGISEYGYRLSATPINIRGNSDVDFLVDLLREKRRWRNVVVVSCDNGFNCLIDAENIARRTSGISHVCVINPTASHRLSERVGKELSVFDRGIRIYRPNFSEEDNQTRHPLVLRRQIEESPFSTRKAFESAIRRECFRTSTEREGMSISVPSFVDIKFAATKSRLTNIAKSQGTDKEVLTAEIAARKAAESQAESAMALALQEEEDRREAELERDGYRAQVLAMQAQVRSLENRLKEFGDNAEIGPRPTKYEDVAGWVEANFSGKLVLHPRAKKALKDALYNDIDIVCSALALLANEYRSVLLGEAKKEDFTAVCDSMHIELSGSITEERAKEFGDEYFVFWGNNKYFLHGHLQKGNSRDERHCMRIYFFWSDTDSMIVVGWLPSHLRNRLT